MKTKLGNKFRFVYQTTSDLNGNIIPETRCIVTDSNDNVISENSVVLKSGKNGDTNNKIAARRFVFEKTVNEETISDKNIRRDLWEAFASLRQPENRSLCTQKRQLQTNS